MNAYVVWVEGAGHTYFRFHDKETQRNQVRLIRLLVSACKFAGLAFNVRFVLNLYVTYDYSHVPRNDSR